MKLTLRICLFIGLLVNYGVAIAEPASKESVRSFMVKTGSANMADEMKNQMRKKMVPLFKEMAPDAPDQYWIDSISSMDVNQMIESIIPVYQKYLSEDEVQELSAFFDTEVGKKYVSVLPSIMRESMVIGQKWGQKNAQDIINKYNAQAN